MRRNEWARYLLAAVLVLIIGVVWAVAGEEVKIEVKNKDGEEITIDVNGETEVISLDDLPDGESRDYEVGGHPFTVKRVGDALKLDHAGHGGHAMFMHHGDCDTKNVWVTSGKGAVDCKGEPDCQKRVVVMKRVDGDEMEIDVEVLGDTMFIGDGHHGEHDVIIMKADDGEIDVEALKEKFGDDFEESTTSDGKQVLRWVHEGDGPHPVVIKSMRRGAGDFVHYRCEETGSMLMVKKEDGLLDSYIDPVTACVMEKVDAQVGVHVIKIHEEIETEDE